MRRVGAPAAVDGRWGRFRVGAKIWVRPDAEKRRGTFTVTPYPGAFSQKGPRAARALGQASRSGRSCACAVRLRPLRGWRMRLLLSWTVFRPYPFWGPERYLRAAGALKTRDGRTRALREWWMDAVGRSGGGLWLQGLRFALFGDTGRVPASWSVGSCCPLQGVVGTITRRLQGRVTELATSLSYSLKT